MSKSKSRKQIKQQIESIESLAASLRESIAEAQRQLDAQNHAPATVLAKSIWPAVIFVAHRRCTGGTKPLTSTTTHLIAGLKNQAPLPASLLEQLREADIAAVMGAPTQDNAVVIIAASIAALDATEAVTGKRPTPATKSPATRRRPALIRWATAAAGLFTAGATS